MKAKNRLIVLNRKAFEDWIGLMERAHRLLGQTELANLLTVVAEKVDKIDLVDYVVDDLILAFKGGEPNEGYVSMLRPDVRDSITE